MRINPEVLKQLHKTYGVAPIPAGDEKIEHMFSLCTRAPRNDEETLTKAKYVWSDSENAYVMGDQKISFFPPKNFLIWVWQDVLMRALPSGEKLIKWVKGDEAYPEGKANRFMKTYSEIVGEPFTPQAPVDRMSLEVPPEEPPLPGPVPDRSTVGVPPSEADQVINNLLAKAKVKPGTKLSKQAPIRLSADQIIDLYQQAQSMNPADSAKLIAFLKTNILPLNEIIKENEFDDAWKEVLAGNEKRKIMAKQLSVQDLSCSVFRPSIPCKLLQVSLHQEGLRA